MTIEEKATIEIPFGAYDSELKGWEYTIPEGMEAEIKDGKVIVKEKESEDERIRKDIISHFESIKALALYDNQEESEDIVSSCNKKIAWLEKQKINTEGDFARGYDCGYECCLNSHGAEWFEKQKEQKPIENPFDANETMKMKDGIDDGFTKFMEKEQKPTEWSETFEENIRILLHDKLTWHSEDGSMSSTVFIDDKTLKDIINGIWFYVGKEALKYPNKELKTAEWSEDIIQKAVKEVGLTQHQIDWFKTNVFPPKQEWSVEDENKLNHILEIVHIASGREASIDEKEELELFLKSLRPQPHTVSIKNANKFAELEYERGVKDGIQSEKSRHWKPSEEQMEALEKTTRFANFGTDAKRRDALLSLYEQLKKLM